MDHFLNKVLNIFKDDELDEFGGLETIKNNLVNSFFKDKNIEYLEFVDIDDGCNIVGIFRYKNEFLYYYIELEKWHTMYYEILNFKTKDKCKLVKLIENSSNNIEFILYPFFSKEENDVFNFKPEYIVDMTNAKELIVKKLDKCIVVDWKYGFKLYINDNTYMIKKNGYFISGFIDKETHFQIGDCCITANILSNDELIVYNYGDVSSAVIIRLLDR